MIEQLVDFFETIPSWQRAVILTSGIFLFWLIEGVFPLKRILYNRYRHAWVNIVFTLTTVVVNFALAFMLLAASDYTAAHQFGINHLIQLPLWAEVVLGLMILDFIGAYLIHFIQHKVKLMWRFHLIHHSDIYVDTTTANRHHPGESVFRAVFTALAILFSGASIGIVMLYQSLSALFSQFNHANINLPKWLDGLISWVIVSPNMHKVHHHYQQPYTDSNYGNIFSIWDRMFGTYKFKQPDTIVYGVDTHMNFEESDSIKNLFEMPFQPYRSNKDIKTNS
jgi:sterol desaturase/sphingolipid hydroxylase (fatty acid hydroxylase superfamily)